MQNPWLSFPVALIIAALVTVGMLTLFSTSPSNATAQEDGLLPEGIAGASERDLLAFAKSGNREQKIAALMQLADSPKNLGKIVPVLAKYTISQDELVRAAAVVALERIGSPASEHLAPLFESEDVQEYRAACGVAQVLGQDARQWVPLMTKHLTSDDPNRVMGSLFGLKNMGMDVVPAMDQLIILLDHKDFNVQCGVCRILEKLGPDAAPAQDRLVKLLNKGVLSARSWAAIALGAIGPSSKHDVVGLLNAKLTAFTQIEKERALIGLGHLGPNAKPALDEVKRLMNDPRKSTQCQAAVTYWRITGDADTAVRVLVEQLPNESYKRDAIMRLGEMGPAAEPGLNALIKELGNSADDTVELAVMAIGKLGATAKPAIPALERFSTHKDQLLRQAAADAIKSINAADPGKEQ